MAVQKVDEEDIRQVMAVYFSLFPTDDPYREQTETNKVVDHIYQSSITHETN